MSIYPYTPYTYLIGWSKLDRWYYGARYRKGCHPSDFWNPYKTSSKHVAAFIKEHGDPDIIEIRKTFSTSKETRIWESKVLKRMKVIRSKRWLNMYDGVSIDPNAISSFQKGRAKSAIHKNRIGLGNKNKRRNDNTKRIISEKIKELPKIKCDKCGTMSSIGNHRRWHGDKCGKKFITINNGKRNISWDISEPIPMDCSIGKILSLKEINSVGAKKSVTINDIIYHSITDAIQMTGISYHMIKKYHM